MNIMTLAWGAFIVGVVGMLVIAYYIVRNQMDE